MEAEVNQGSDVYSIAFNEAGTHFVLATSRGWEHRFIRQQTGQMSLTLVTSRVAVETVRLAVEGLVM